MVVEEYVGSALTFYGFVVEGQSEQIACIDGVSTDDYYWWAIKKMQPRERKAPEEVVVAVKVCYRHRADAERALVEFQSVAAHTG